MLLSKYKIIGLLLKLGENNIFVLTLALLKVTPDNTAQQCPWFVVPPLNLLTLVWFPVELMDEYWSSVNHKKKKKKQTSKKVSSLNLNPLSFLSCFLVGVV